MDLRMNFPAFTGPAIQHQQIRNHFAYMALASVILPALANTVAARASPMASRKFQTELKNCFMQNSYLIVCGTGVTSILRLMRWLCIWCLNTVPNAIDNLAWGTSQQDVL